ncbi:RNA exonuclease 4-like [Homarus americanus]|uniref:RNA exonuclease 4-like n=1 Tax=Homarus americanus TaxID=6706 RepID=UPI001C4784D0|nr:RNA exonuclease 4-like [Homarus americanus]
MATAAIMKSKLSISNDASQIVKTNTNDLIRNIPPKQNENGKELGDGKSYSKKKKWKWRKNKKPVKSSTNQSASETSSSIQISHPVISKLEGNSDSLQPAKKRRRKKKSKGAVEVTSAENTTGFKPVLILKKPDDYSANWKQLKEIITKEDKKVTETPTSGTKEGKINKQKSKVGGENENTQKHKKKKNIGNVSLADQEKEKLDIWFDNVDPILLYEAEEDIVMENKRGMTHKEVTKDSRSDDTGHTAALVKTKSFEGVTKVIAMDCEMVGVGMNGQDSILARVSVVNHFGKVLYDKFVQPMEEVIDYRTEVSGIRPSDLEDGADFSTVQKEISELIKGKILVGHALLHDLKVLYLSHPRSHIRDTSRYKGFLRLFGGRTPSLKKLTERLMGVKIQEGEHSSVQDAQAAMRLYTMHRRQWENLNSKKQRKLAGGGKKTKATTAVNQKESTNNGDE